MRLEEIVEGIQDLADAQLMGPFDGGIEGTPEIVEHGLPIGATVGNLIEFGFQVGGKVVADVAGEKSWSGRPSPAAPGRRE